DLGAEQANLADAQVLVAAEVARNYFELRGTQKRGGKAGRNGDDEFGHAGGSRQARYNGNAASGA
ncbi:hypothetical protein C7E15_20505, partial [Stenotrophomonas maltophilia]